MNETDAVQHSKFVSYPDSRSTLNILWSSLFTIIACTWTVQHLNVPKQRESYKPGWRGTFRWTASKFVTKMKWMMITIIAPEIVIGGAFVNYLEARKTLRALMPFAREDGVAWTLTHSYFANMGGFVIRSRPLETSQMLPTVLRKGRRSSSFLDVTDQRPNMEANGPKENPDDPTTVSDSTSPIQFDTLYHLFSADIYQFRKDDVLPKLPNITQAELEDRSKSDPFVKFITLAQILWATLQVIVRSARGLSISQLEVTVIAFAVCAADIYAIHWRKPKDVGATTTILEFEGPIPYNVLRSYRHKHSHTKMSSVAEAILGWETMYQKLGDPVRNDSLMITSIIEENGLDCFGIATELGSVVFGCVHIGAWNFHFPTKSEQILWRYASLYTTGCGALFMSLDSFFAVILRCYDIISHGSLRDGYTDKVNYASGLISRTCFYFYVLARLALLVEVIRTLFFLPPDAYVSTWTQYIPHVS